MTSDDRPTLRQLTIGTLDSLGVPENPLRRLALELADLIDDRNTDAEVLAIVTGVYRYLDAELRELYRERTPAEEQLEYLSAVLDLHEMTGKLPRGFTDEGDDARPDDETGAKA